MTRDNRIKEYKFANAGVVASAGSPAAGANQTVYSEFPLNGEILEVDWSWFGTGSIAVSLSGTGEEIFRRNAPSGTGVQVGNPRKFSQSTTGSIANAEHIPFIANDKLVLQTTNLVSGTSTLAVNVRYR